MSETADSAIAIRRAIAAVGGSKFPFSYYPTIYLPATAIYLSSTVEIDSCGVIIDGRHERKNGLSPYIVPNVPNLTCFQVTGYCDCSFKNMLIQCPESDETGVLRTFVAFDFIQAEHLYLDNCEVANAKIGFYFSGTENGKAKYKDVKELPDGATISVPNDGTNESRALTLLQTAGLIKLDVKDGELATIKNISENPKKLDIKEISAEQAAQTLSSVDAAVVNNSYAQQQNVDYDTTLFQEDPSQDLKDWVNIIAANKDWEKSNKADAIKTLIKAYQNDEVAQIIYDASNKVDLPAWKGAPTQDQLKANSKK